MTMREVRNAMRPRWWAVLVIVLFAGACGKDGAPDATAADGAGANEKKPPAPSARRGGSSEMSRFLEGEDEPATAALPPGHPPIGPSRSTGGPAMSGQGAPAADAGPEKALEFDAPESWKAQVPESSMRKAQFVLPRAEGDAEDGELVVYYFGVGQGGAVDANLERWKGMFTAPDGSPLGEEASRVETFEANGLKVTVLDVAGRYAAASMMPGQAPVESKDNHRMLAAVIETPQGPWFFKATGPSETMNEHYERIMEFSRSVRF